MNVSQNGELPNGGLVTSMRRVIIAVAAATVAASLMLLAGCAPDSSPSGGAAPSTSETGPITFAVGKDYSGVFSALIAGWNHALP